MTGGLTGGSQAECSGTSTDPPPRLFRPRRRVRTVTSSSPPTLPLADGTMSIGSFTDPIVVDPDPSLLAALAAAYRDAAPEAVNPDLDALRDAARGDEAPLSPAADLPRLTVLARDHVVDAITDPFYSASQLAALTEAGVWDLRTLAAPQPNAVLAGRSDGCVVIAASSGRDGDGASESPPIADRGAGSAPIRRSATATSISSRTRRRCESERRAAIGCTARSGTGAGARSRTRPCDCSTPATILSTAARRASGRTPPVRAAPPSIATCGAPARTPGSGARRRSPG